MRERRTSISARAREIGVHRGTLLRWIQDGIGPKAIKVGRTTIIPDEAWDAWKRRNRAEVA